MPPLSDVDAMVSAARSRNIRFSFIIQNFAQLNDVYGKEVAATLRGNCGNTIYLISTEMAALEEISKMCGEVKSKEKDKTASTPLVTVTDLQKMKLFQAIIMRIRMSPFKTQYEPDFKINWGIDRKELAFPHREHRPIAMFDLKTYVSEAKRKQMMENASNGSNGGVDNSFNPFMPNSMGGMNNPFLGGMGGINSMNHMGTGSMRNPMASNSMDLPQKPLSSLTNDEIDKMIADIDKKLKELDEEEAREKAKLAEKKSIELPKRDESISTIPTTSSIMEEPKKVEAPTILSEEKPKINVDADSIVMNDNTITDDEFFDDFFGDDE